MKRNDFKLKMQLKCPNCKHEFQYNRGHIDEKIDTLGMEITKIMGQLREYKTKSKREQIESKNWYIRTTKALTDKQMKISELKKFRKNGEYEVMRNEYQLFRNAVKEICGEKAFYKCCEMANEDRLGFNVSDAAKKQYTRRNGESVSNVTKL